MNGSIIENMVTRGYCSEGHFKLDSVHTNKNMNITFIYDYEIADAINIKLYHRIKADCFENDHPQFDQIVTTDPISALIAYPLAMMFKRNISQMNVITTEKQLVIASFIKDSDDLHAIKMMVDSNPVKYIVCLTNYSGVTEIKGIKIIEILGVDTWSDETCPVCNKLA